MSVATIPSNVVVPTQNAMSFRPSSIPSEHEMMVFHTMAEQAVSSKMYKGIGEKPGVMMIMLAARELAIPPMQALNGGLNIINGKVEISARMMNAMIRRAGHQIIVHACTDMECILIGKRCDTGESQKASYSVADAQRAGLVKQGGGWTKFPKDMCFARALSRLARQLFSDVIGMGYVEGEISQSMDAKIIDPPMEPAIEPEPTEAEYIQTFLNKFPPEERSFAMLWMEIIQKHFEWSVSQTICEILKDEKKMFEKFHAWKEKQQGNVK